MLVIEGDNSGPDIDNTLLVDKTFRTEFDSVFVFNGISFQLSCSQADRFVIRQFDRIQPLGVFSRLQQDRRRFEAI